MKPYCHLRPEKESKLLITLKSRQRKRKQRVGWSMQCSGVFLGLCTGLSSFDDFRSKNMCAAGLLDLDMVWLGYRQLPPLDFLMCWGEPKSQTKETCLAHPTSSLPQAFLSFSSAFLTHTEYQRKQGPCVVCIVQVSSHSLRPTPAASDNCIQMCVHWAGQEGCQQPGLEILTTGATRLPGHTHLPLQTFPHNLIS